MAYPQITQIWLLASEQQFCGGILSFSEIQLPLVREENPRRQNLSHGFSQQPHPHTPTLQLNVLTTGSAARTRCPQAHSTVSELTGNGRTRIEEAEIGRAWGRLSRSHFDLVFQLLATKGRARWQSTSALEVGSPRARAWFILTWPEEGMCCL